jgi:hypothetical protein
LPLKNQASLGGDPSYQIEFKKIKSTTKFTRCAFVSRIRKADTEKLAPRTPRKAFVPLGVLGVLLGAAAQRPWW